jgi:SRSO17 transposase
VEPTEHCFSTLPVKTRLRDLVRWAKLRWRIERHYQDLKQELGSAIARDATGAASIITQR